MSRELQLGGSLELVEANLSSDKGWNEARRRLHLRAARRVAVSARGAEGRERRLIPSAVDGATRVLTGSAAPAVKRVVMTSSVAAVAFGHT